MNSINSFSDLLAQGQIPQALQLRLEAIEATARHYRQDLEAAKVSSAALGVVGLLLSANPLIAVIAGCGLAGYGWTVLRDYQNTKRLCLLPLVRKGTGELLTGIGLAAANEQGEADDPLLGVIGYVEPELAHEYELVMVAEVQLTSYLAQLPGESRLNAFRHIIRHTRLRNSLKLPSLQDVALAIASPVPSTKPTLPAVKPDSAPAIEVKAEVVQPTPSAQPTGELHTPTPPGKDVRDSFSRTSAPLPRFDRDRIINESKGLMIVGDMGAAKTCVAQYIANGFNGYGIIVFDPHGMTDWGNAYVICKMGAIYEQMRILLDLLEQGDTEPDTDSPSIDTGNDTDPTRTAETIANTSGESGIGQIPDWGIDTSANTKRYTPALLTSEQMLILIQRMLCHTSQTQIIQDLWSVEKNKQGWKQAYAEYKELMREG